LYSVAILSDNEDIIEPPVKKMNLKSHVGNDSLKRKYARKQNKD